MTLREEDVKELENISGREEIGGSTDIRDPPTEERDTAIRSTCLHISLLYMRLGLHTCNPSNMYISGDSSPDGYHKHRLFC